MEKKVMKYAVLQGVMASDGCGDSNMQAEFSNKKDALKYFNRVKKVTRDWYISKVEHLETLLVKYTDDLCEDFEILELFEKEKN